MSIQTELCNSWFNKLHKKRKNALVVFKDPEYVNVFNGVIDKYCDSAHFIYELLQKDRKHNRLGHINAITAIGFSSKNQTLTDDVNDIKIGKFGVGFKAVFQYTTTPYIYI